jgi:LysR family transcriptional activator of dmlA
MTAAVAYGERFIVPIVNAFMVQYPQLRVEIELTNRVMDLVHEGFDLAIRLGRLENSSLVASRIAPRALYLCAAPAYLAQCGTPQTLADLQNHRCIPIRERDQDFGRWELHGPAGVAAIKVSGPLSANNGEIVRQWAIDGHGIILRSTWDVGRDIAAGLLAPVLPQYFQPADVWAVYPSRLSVSAKVKVCVEFLEAWFAQGGMSAA